MRLSNHEYVGHEGAVELEHCRSLGVDEKWTNLGGITGTLRITECMGIYHLAFDVMKFRSVQPDSIEALMH